MAKSITAYTPRGEPSPRIAFLREEDGRVAVRARDADGREIVVEIPHDAWFPMARQIFQSRSQLCMTVEFGRQR